MAVITKNALVTRDLDLLQPMAEARMVNVSISVTTSMPNLGRTMEPRTSSPERGCGRSALADAGVPVRVMVSAVHSRPD